MSELFKADNEYKEWIAGISTDFRRSQIRASMKINDEMLRFYWKLGKGISSMSEQFGYGTRFYKTVSDDLKSILPDVKSFSPTNLKYMRYFYEMYPDAVICPQVEDELITDANRPQLGDDLQIIFRIPWGHNKIILDKCKGARIRVMMRRKPQFTSNQLKIADLILDRDTRKVTRAGNEIDLSAKEFMVLECLMRNKNIVMTRQQIEQNAWDFDFEGGSNVIDVYIRYLRKKIDAQYEQKLIHTVRGVGYVMRENE